MYQYLNLFHYLGVSLTSPHMERTGVPPSVIGMIERRIQAIQTKHLISRQANLEANIKVIQDKLEKVPEKLCEMLQQQVAQPVDVLQTNLNLMRQQQKLYYDNLSAQMAARMAEIAAEVKTLHSSQNNRKRKYPSTQQFVELSSSGRQTMSMVQREKILTIQLDMKCDKAWQLWWNPDSECNCGMKRKLFKGHKRSFKEYSRRAALFKAFVVHLTDENVEMKHISEDMGVALPENLDDLYYNHAEYIEMLCTWFESEKVPLTLDIFKTCTPATISNILLKSSNYTYPSVPKRNEAMKNLILEH